MYHSIIVIVVLSLSCVRLWLLCPQDFPPKNTGVGCHLLLQSTFPTQGWKSMSPALAGGFFFTTKPPGIEYCCIESCSVVSDSLRPHGLYSSWNSSGLNTGVGTLSLLQGIF